MNKGLQCPSRNRYVESALLLMLVTVSCKTPETLDSGAKDYQSGASRYVSPEDYNEALANPDRITVDCEKQENDSYGNPRDLRFTIVKLNQRSFNGYWKFGQYVAAFDCEKVSFSRGARQYFFNCRRRVSEDPVYAAASYTHALRSIAVDVDLFTQIPRTTSDWLSPFRSLDCQYKAVE